tara:strand:- start:2929 stop:3663 length:735 start_codon:yes stop_codon:yes gene_type:complete
MAVAFRLRMKSAKIALAAVSPYMARAWKKEMRDYRELLVLPNVSLMDEVRTAALKSPTPVVVELASAASRKNVRTLITAFARVRAAIPDAELRLFGHGLTEDGELARAAAHSGEAQGVRFMGHADRAQSQAELRRAWVHAHLSLEESFGNTLIEAMQVGTAVLAGENSGAVPWVLGDGEGGLLVDATDPAAVARALTALLSSPEKRDELVAGAYRVLADRHSTNAVVDAHLRVYRSLAVPTVDQ